MTHGWPLVLGIIGAVNDRHGEALIRIAFQCLQLVVTDFLPVMPWRCLPLCVNTAAKFGSQTQELNISLTAVGLMVCYMNDFNFFFMVSLYLSLQTTFVTNLNIFHLFSGTFPITSIKIRINYRKLYLRIKQFCLISQAL